MKLDERQRAVDAAPTVSVIMANYHSGRFIEAAMDSVLTQSLRDLELIVSDDGSSDDSLSRIATVAARDSRVRVLRSPGNTGPAAARNRALELARGRWIAIMDSDDLIHPERLERLIAAAERDGADIVADDLLAFADDGLALPFTCLRGAAARAPQWLGVAQFIRSNAMYASNGVLGYLKPVISAELLARTGIRYDSRLPINEDYDFSLRLMVAGARYRVYPDLTYFYRRHSASTSHRISRSSLESMLTSGDEFRADLGASEPAIVAAFNYWRSALVRAIAYDGILAALKRHHTMMALRLALQNPAAGALLRLPVRQRLKRFFTPPARQDVGPRRVCVLTRQWIVGSKNASSAYLLSLCQALRRSGFELDLVCPSPAVFSRWPALILGSDRRLFRAVAVRGGWRIGHVVVARDPAILFKVLLTGLHRAAPYLGIRTGGAAKRAIGSIGLRLTREDSLFVARHARKADAIISDHVFLTEAIAHALCPDAPSATIIYGLSSLARPDAPTAVTWLDRTTKIAVLARADTVVATQAREAAIVRQAQPHHRVIVAPMAVAPVAAAQPGQGAHVLCVGTDMASNIDALGWLLAEVWPRVRQAVPTATLTVAGSVSRTLGTPPEAVRFLGTPEDLAPLYRTASVVVIPLRTGAEPEDKLVEAFAHGKAVVATPGAAQSVEKIVSEAVVIADGAADFATAIIQLIGDDALRLARANMALRTAQEHFSAAARYEPFLDFVTSAKAQNSLPQILASSPT